MGIKAEKGDWIIGTSPVAQGSKLVYAMQVSERLPFEEYYTDERFAKKSPMSKARGARSAAIIFITKTNKVNGFNISRFLIENPMMKRRI
jgi:Nucleotide modification associated domain 2